VVPTVTDAANTELPLEQQKQFSMLVHLSGLLFPVLGALVGYLLWKDKGETISANVRSALNFNISVAIYFVAANVIATLTFFLVVPLALPFVVWAFYVIMCIIAGVKANNGEHFSYPLTITFIK
jgi:uncharacterized Tic20 family protein